jgi:hypothetical protein
MSSGRLGAGKGQVQRVRAEVEVARPLKLAMAPKLHLIEHILLVPGRKDSSASEVGQVHLAFGAVLVAQPETVTRERPDFHRSNHVTSLPYLGKRVHSFA